MWRLNNDVENRILKKEAVEDLKKLDNSQRVQVIKAIEKVSKNPLPQSEGGFGKVLGDSLLKKSLLG
jgi:mRNA interferase RelE/StbE